MSPEQRQIRELQKQVTLLTNFMLSFNNVGQLAPEVQRTIQIVAGNATLAGLSDVTITTPSNGQVLEYLNGIWINATDNT